MSCKGLKPALQTNGKDAKWIVYSSSLTSVKMSGICAVKISDHDEPFPYYKVSCTVKRKLIKFVERIKINDIQ